MYHKQLYDLSNVILKTDSSQISLALHWLTKRKKKKNLDFKICHQ